MKVLDLFCGAGGVAMGLHRAWPLAEIVGVDIKPQPRYPFTFVQGDACNPPFDLTGFDFIWASPPCQAYCMMQRVNTRAKHKDHPRLIEPIRALLEGSGVPYVIENVVGGPLLAPFKLCGSSFGLKVRRHRMFESNVLLLGMPCRHDKQGSPIAVYGDHPQQPGDKTYRVNRARTLAEGQEAMGIDWMPWRELTQAIPPAYSEYIARQVASESHATRSEGPLRK